MINSFLSQLRIVLVEPAGALNLGSIARVMKNMGLHQIVLVNPHCHPGDDEARLMAVHAADVLESAHQVTTLPEALAGCHRAVATTARERDIPDDPLKHPRVVLPWLLGLNSEGTSVLEAGIESALIFGPEDRGLSNTELSYAQRCLRIPSSPIYPSLNLAQAVAICCYEIYQLALRSQHPNGVQSTYLGEGLARPHCDGGQAHLVESDAQAISQGSSAASVDQETCNTPTTPDLQQTLLTSSNIAASPDLASLDEVEGFYGHLEDVLLKIGYLYGHTADSRMKKFRRLFNRVGLTSAEVSMLRGILRQMTWAAQHPGNIADKSKDQGLNKIQS